MGVRTLLVVSAEVDAMVKDRLVKDESETYLHP